MSERKKEYDRKRYFIQIIESRGYDIDYVNKSSLELKQLIKEIRKKHKTEADYHKQKLKVMELEDKEELGDDYDEPFILPSQEDYTKELDSFYDITEDETELNKRLQKLHDELTPEQKELIREGQSSLIYGKGGKEVKDFKPFKKSLPDSLEWLRELEKKRKEQERLKAWKF